MTETPRFYLVDTWNGGTEHPVCVFVGTENECMEWVHANTSFSFSEATRRQGYALRPVVEPDWSPLLRDE